MILPGGLAKVPPSGPEAPRQPERSPALLVVAGSMSMAVAFAIGMAVTVLMTRFARPRLLLHGRKLNSASGS